MAHAEPEMSEGATGTKGVHRGRRESQQLGGFFDGEKIEHGPPTRNGPRAQCVRGSFVVGSVLLMRPRAKSSRPTRILLEPSAGHGRLFGCTWPLSGPRGSALEVDACGPVGLTFRPAHSSRGYEVQAGGSCAGLDRAGFRGPQLLEVAVKLSRKSKSNRSRAFASRRAGWWVRYPKRQDRYFWTEARLRLRRHMMSAR
jgi:hypothetical protein